MISNYEDGHKEILDIIQNIPRIVPYSYESENLCFKDRDGLLEYKNEIDYLEKDYKEILEDNNDFLEKIRKIRNKYTHKMHGVRHSSSGMLYDF